MRVETSETFGQKIVDALSDLVRANLDSVRGFQEAASIVADESLELYFRDLVEERRQMAFELQAFVAVSGERVPEEGTWLAAFRRYWVDLKAMITNQDTNALLVEVERGERLIKEAYEAVLKQTCGSALNDVLQRHYAQVRAGEDTLLDLQFRFQPQ